MRVCLVRVCGACAFVWAYAIHTNICVETKSTAQALQRVLYKYQELAMHAHTSLRLLDHDRMHLSYVLLMTTLSRFFSQCLLIVYVFRTEHPGCRKGMHLPDLRELVWWPPYLAWTHPRNTKQNQESTQHTKLAVGAESEMQDSTRSQTWA